MTGDRSKVWCCKEQYCIGTWNVRSMNQGKLEVVKQEMARVNVYNLGICKVKWTGISELNSDDHNIYYCGKESLRRNGVAITVKKEPEMQYLDAVSKKTEWSLFISKANHAISWQFKSMTQPKMLKKLKLNRFYKNLQDLLELTSKKVVLFIIGDWNANVGNQETPGVTGKFGLGVQNEAVQRLTEFCQENTLIRADTLF